MKSDTIESIIEKYIDENTNSIPITSIHAISEDIYNFMEANLMNVLYDLRCAHNLQGL